MDPVLRTLLLERLEASELDAEAKAARKKASAGRNTAIAGEGAAPEPTEGDG